MLPELPQNLQSLYAKNCESLEKVHLSKMLEVLDLTCCRKLTEIQGWENVQFLRQMKLGGVPHIKFSENIKQVLIHHWWDFEYTLPDNEIPSWITSKKEGSSISFSLPLSNLEFLGLCVWVVLKPALRPSLHRQYHVTIENDGFKVDSRSYWIELLVGEEISFLHPITRDDLISRGIQEVGEIIKVTSKIEHFGECMVKKIGIEALYRGRDGLQFVPITKVGLNTMKRKRHF